MLATKLIYEVSVANEAEGDGVAEGEVLGVDQKFVDDLVGVGWIDPSES